MGIWLTELRRNLPADIVLHVVGTKADIVAKDPSRREVPFERCIAYVAENLAPGQGGTPPPTAQAPSAAALMGMTGSYFFGGGLNSNPRDSTNTNGNGNATGAADGRSSTGMLSSHPSAGQGGMGGPQQSTGALPQSTEPKSPSSKRSSGFWGQEVGWDACHEISAESGEGVEEVFRVVTRKLVEQDRKMQRALLAATATPGLDFTPSAGGYGAGGMYGDGSGGGPGGGTGGYFDGVSARGSFRVGRDRRSWLFSPGFSPAVTTTQEEGPGGDSADGAGRRRRGCC